MPKNNSNSKKDKNQKALIMEERVDNWTPHKDMHLKKHFYTKKQQQRCSLEKEKRSRSASLLLLLYMSTDVGPNSFYMRLWLVLRSERHETHLAGTFPVVPKKKKTRDRKQTLCFTNERKKR